MNRLINLTNQRFGKLVVIKRVGTNKQKSSLWECRCDCEKIVTVSSGHLRFGDTKSCGCHRRAIATKHGHNTDLNGKSSTYSSWDAMIQRCTNKNHASYRNYGGRGITICERWLNFKNFLADMGEKPEGLTIERIDNNKNYEPSNCKWILKTEQSFNRRVNKLSKDKVEDIRRSDKPNKELAAIYNVRTDYISKVKNYKVWE